MGRKKKAVAQGWNAINKQRADKHKPNEPKEEKVTPEEHEARLKLLKELGLIK